MTEAQVGLLVKAAACFGKTQNSINPVHNVLKSFYLMRCREITKGFGLPVKYFSPQVRCSRCFIEWGNNTETKIQAVKLSKRQRRKISKLRNSNKDYIQSNENKLEKTCTFCEHRTETQLLKPPRPKVTSNTIISKNTIVKTKTSIEKKTCVQIAKDKKKTNNAKGKQIQNIIKNVEVNVYSRTNDVFSLTNKDNTLTKTVKEEKVIKNNKKKKDKFAGLCQQAVLASAKLKQKKEKQDKLNLFLKPST